MLNSIKKAGISTVYNYLEKDPEKNLPKLMEWVDRFAGDGPNSFPKQREVIRKVVNDPESNWYQLIVRLLKETDKDVLKTIFTNFFLNGNLIGWKTQQEYRDKYNCNIPWAILLDPTSACNLHCTGCWAAEYGNRLNLSLEEIDSIITQGKEMGVYTYIYTGGEPLVRKKDLITLCEKHNDCVFLSFTNATLIDEDFAKEMLRVKNFIPAISVEGDEASHDGRRGEGSFDKVVRAMNILKENRLPFGISCCYTSQNLERISSEEFYDQMIAWGAAFGGTSTICPWATTPPPTCCPPRSSGSSCTTRSAVSARPRPCSAWTSRTTASTWAAASRAAAGTCTSTPTATWIPACSSTTPTATSGKRACWSACAPRCSWPTTTASPSMRTTCARAPCWRTRRSCAP